MMRYLMSLAVCLSFAMGCTEDQSAPETTDNATQSALTPAEDSTPVADSPGAPPTKLVIPSISIGASDASNTTALTPQATPEVSEKEQRANLLAAMKPLQVMLGTWRGTTQKAVGDFKAVDKPNWIWDFQSDRKQPAMVMTSEASPYFREARLTFLTNEKRFQLSTTDPEGNKRTYQGDFSKPVEEFEGDDSKMHLSYKLELKQIDAQSKRDQWQIVFNQQENNRYLVEMYRGPSNLRFDTVATQRQGTSFAKSDTDYGEKECIISGGLGTIQVSYDGKSYWVCCTGCKAAFEEDPTSWIAEYEEKQAKKAAGS